MYSLMDASNPGEAPLRNDYSPASLYCLLWMLLGSFFALNLFVGVVINEFNRIKAEQDGSATMTSEQTQWVHTLKATVHELPVPALKLPASRWRVRLFYLCQSRTFENVITAAIMINIGVMAGNYWRVESVGKPDREVSVHAMASCHCQLLATS